MDYRIHLIWAIFTLIIAIIFIIIFKDPLSNVLNQLAKKSKIRSKWINIDLGEHYPSNYLQRDNKNYEKAHQSPIVNIEENAIHQKLVDSGFDIEKQREVLVNHLANANIFLRMLIIDSNIYNEQVQFLSQLNTSSSNLSDNDAIKLYNIWFEQAPNNQKSYTYEQYMDFLLKFDLISKDSNGYKITQLGQEYLIYRTRLKKDLYPK